MSTQKDSRFSFYFDNSNNIFYYETLVDNQVVRKDIAIHIDAYNKEISDYIQQISELEGLKDELIKNSKSMYEELVVLGKRTPILTEEEKAIEERNFIKEQSELNKSLVSSLKDLQTTILELSNEVKNIKTKPVEEKSDKQINKKI